MLVGGLIVFFIALSTNILGLKQQLTHVSHQFFLPCLDDLSRYGVGILTQLLKPPPVLRQVVQQVPVDKRVSGSEKKSRRLIKETLGKRAKHRLFFHHLKGSSIPFLLFSQSSVRGATYMTFARGRVKLGGTVRVNRREVFFANTNLTSFSSQASW